MQRNARGIALDPDRPRPRNSTVRDARGAATIPNVAITPITGINDANGTIGFYGRATGVPRGGRARLAGSARRRTDRASELLSPSMRESERPGPRRARGQASFFTICRP